MAKLRNCIRNEIAKGNLKSIFKTSDVTNLNRIESTCILDGEEFSVKSVRQRLNNHSIGPKDKVGQSVSRGNICFYNYYGNATYSIYENSQSLPGAISLKIPNKTTASKKENIVNETLPDNAKDHFLQKHVQLLTYLVSGWENLPGYEFTNSSSKNYRKSDNQTSTYFSLKSAYEDYSWDGDDFKLATQKLIVLKSELESALSVQDENRILIVAANILRWGGVLTTAIGGPFLDKNKKQQLGKYLLDIRLLFESDTVSREDFLTISDILLSDSGATKVYTLLCKYCVIYDDRVAASLGYIISKFIGAKELPDDLNLTTGEKDSKEKRNRNASSQNHTFRRKGATKKAKSHHAMSNVKANWLLEEVAIRLINENGSFRKEIEYISECLEYNEKRWIALRVVEASLFMAGHNVPLIAKTK
jgi:hypothetical protein